METQVETQYGNLTCQPTCHGQFGELQRHLLQTFLLFTSQVVSCFKQANNSLLQNRFFQVVRHLLAEVKNC